MLSSSLDLAQLETFVLTDRHKKNKDDFASRE